MTMMIFLGVGVAVLVAYLVFTIWKKNKEGQSVNVKTLIESLGVDLSEGVETAVGSAATFLLFVFEFFSVYAEANNYAELHQFRADSLITGFVLAGIAMVGGIVAAKEGKLWHNTVTERKNDILMLKNEFPKEFKLAMEQYKKHVASSRSKTIVAALIAIGGHAAIALMCFTALQSHEQYAEMVATGAIQADPNVPVHDTMRIFFMPYNVSFWVIGSVGLVLDFFLGLTSDIEQELRNFKPDMDKIKELNSWVDGSSEVLTLKKSSDVNPNSGGGSNDSGNTPPTSAGDNKKEDAQSDDEEEEEEILTTPPAIISGDDNNNTDDDDTHDDENEAEEIEAELVDYVDVYRKKTDELREDMKDTQFSFDLGIVSANADVEDILDDFSDALDRSSYDFGMSFPKSSLLDVYATRSESEQHTIQNTLSSAYDRTVVTLNKLTNAHTDFDSSVTDLLNDASDGEMDESTLELMYDQLKTSVHDVETLSNDAVSAIQEFISTSKRVLK